MRPLLLIIMLLMLWAAVTMLHPAIDPIILPSPVAVLKAAGTLIVGGGLLRDIGVTLRRTLIALSISVVLGLPLGLFLGYRRNWYRSVEGLIHALRSVPVTA